MRRSQAARWAIAGAAAITAMSALSLPARATGTDPTSSDPLGPLLDVTSHWRAYQPRTDFCIKPTVFEFPATTETSTGADPVCAGSGFPASATGLYKVHVETPVLCDGCRRLFIDYSKISTGTAEAPTSHGHAYFRLMSLNQSYTVSPLDHSPNVKNLTNDYLVAPPGSPVPVLTAQADRYDMAYAADTANYAHIAAQGPYYVGPGYPNIVGKWINGAYLDVDLEGATRLPLATANAVRYAAGFDSSPSTCADAAVFGPSYTDGNYLYGGCVNAFGGSLPPGVDPWPGA